MPRAKRPLAEADPNASRFASNPKSSKTGTGRIRKTADGDILKGDSEKESAQPKRVATRNKSPGTATSSSPKAPLREKERQPPSNPKFTANPRLLLRLPGSTYSDDVDTDAANRSHEDLGNKAESRSVEGSGMIHEREINYKTKDNSKLRVLLSDRCMSTLGSREELISRLVESPFNYDTYSSEQIVELLKERHLTNTALGSKAVKIQRLLLNDSLDRDTSNHEDMMLYVRTDLRREWLEELVAKQEAMLAGEDRSYSTSTWTLSKLRALLKDRKLPFSGTKEEMIARLRTNDGKRLTNDISNSRKEYHSLKEQLEAQIGHPVEDTDLMRKEKSVTALDNQLQSQGQMSRPGKPICDYNWRESHWASRTERELREICTRREMPGGGYGTKAAMIKWLETGSIEYEDLYAGSLEMICYRRGIKHRNGEKKVDLIRLLKEADEQESAV